jgi:hypothetical protein
MMILSFGGVSIKLKLRKTRRERESFGHGEGMADGYTQTKRSK